MRHELRQVQTRNGSNWVGSSSEYKLRSIPSQQLRLSHRPALSNLQAALVAFCVIGPSLPAKQPAGDLPIQEMLATAGRPPPSDQQPSSKKTKRLGPQERRILAALKEPYPPNGVVPDNERTKDVLNKINGKLADKQGRGEVSWDTVNNALARNPRRLR